jgi:hypothetical protein
MWAPLTVKSAENKNFPRINYMRKYELVFYKPFKINGPRRKMWNYKFLSVSTVIVAKFKPFSYIKLYLETTS